MHYRPFGKLDFRVSALGFGAMRLPTIGDKIDEGEATRMLRYAIDHGVNYVDTAWPYHNGQSEAFVGRALTEGYRSKVKVATKLPCWEIKTAADFDKYLDNQIARLGLEAIDFYLLHALNRDGWLKMRDLGVIAWAEKAMASGRFRHFGFSFHDDFDALKQIIDSYDWSMCQIQYNYMEVDKGAGIKGLHYAAAKGLATVIMEPLLGGRLVNPPQPVQSLWDSADKQRSATGWALEWLWNQPEIATVLSGMSTLDQVKEDVALADSSCIGSLSALELELVCRARTSYQDLTVIPCTACKYCMPCPNDVDIPGNLAAYNNGMVYDKPEAARGEYGWWKHAFEQHIFDKDIRALGCTQCGECVAKCPQNIPISEWMPVIHSVLGDGKPFVHDTKA